MKIHYQMTNVEMTDAIAEYIDKRLSSLDKFFTAPEAYLHLSKNPPTQRNGEGLFKVQLIIEDEGNDYLADHSSHDLYTAIDDIKEDMQRVVRKAKTTEDSLFKKGARKIKKMLRYGS
jgi:putative sigma-54 modulation protein